MVRKMLEMVGNFPYCAALSMEDEVAEIQQHHGSRHAIAGWIDPVLNQSILAVQALKPMVGTIASAQKQIPCQHQQKYADIAASFSKMRKEIRY